MTRGSRRLARLGAALESPRATFLAARMLGWALVLPLLKVCMPLSRLVRLMWGHPAAARDRDLAQEARVGRLSRLATRAASFGRRDNCLERSLIAYRQLAACSADPLLVVGAREGAGGIEGHVWVLVDGRPVHDREEELARYTPLTVFAAGRAQPAA